MCVNKRQRNRFNLTLEQNIFLAKKTMSENIYHAGKFENLNTTFPQTETIVKGLSVAGVDIHDVQVILNMKNAWTYVLNHIDLDVDIDAMCKINGFVAYNESFEWGVLRNGRVGISGVNYVPDIPQRKSVEKEISDILNNKKLSNTYKGIHFMLYAMRTQIFWDGNKQSAMIGANMWLMKHGCGLIAVTDAHFEQFNTLLSTFYETNDYAVIADFIYECCLYGIEFQ